MKHNINKMTTFPMSLFLTEAETEKREEIIRTRSNLNAETLL